MVRNKNSRTKLKNLSSQDKKRNMTRKEYGTLASTMGMKTHLGSMYFYLQQVT